MSNLDRFLDEKLAKEFGVSPEEVTDELIHQKRQELYESPDFKFNLDSMPEEIRLLEYLTPLEIKVLMKRTDTFLDKFR